MYYRDKLNELKGNLRHTWKLINEIINKTKSQSELPDNFVKDDKTISDPTEIAEHFNEYLIKIGPNIANKIPASFRDFSLYLGESNQNSMFLDAITENEVATEIGQLDVNKSGGYDEISPKVVKGVSKHIVKPLTHIYNQSFVTGIVPSELKSKAPVSQLVNADDTSVIEIKTQLYLES